MVTFPGSLSHLGPASAGRWVSAAIGRSLEGVSGGRGSAERRAMGQGTQFRFSVCHPCLWVTPPMPLLPKGHCGNSSEQGDSQDGEDEADEGAEGTGGALPCPVEVLQALRGGGARLQACGALVESVATGLQGLDTTSGPAFPVQPLGDVLEEPRVEGSLATGAPA